MLLFHMQIVSLQKNFFRQTCYTQ